MVEIFKKTTSNFHNMTFKEFKNSIISLANAMHEAKIKSITDKNKYAIIMGNEGQGVNKELLDKCDKYLYIKRCLKNEN